MEQTIRVRAAGVLRTMLTTTRVCMRCSTEYQELYNATALGCAYHPGDLGQHVHGDSMDLHWSCCGASSNRSCPMYDTYLPQGCTACAHTTDVRERPASALTPVPLSLMEGPDASVHIRITPRTVKPVKYVLRHAQDFSQSISQDSVTAITPGLLRSPAFDELRVAFGLPREGCAPSRLPEDGDIPIRRRPTRAIPEMGTSLWTCEATHHEADEQFFLYTRTATEQIRSRMERFWARDRMYGRSGGGRAIRPYYKIVGGM